MATKTHEIRTTKPRRLLIGCVFGAALFCLSIGLIQARAEAPDYLMPFNAPEVQDPDLVFFDPIYAHGALRVPTDQLRAVLDYIDQGRFEPLVILDDTTTAIDVYVTLQRLTLSDNGFGEPAADISIIARVLDQKEDRVILAVIARYNTEPEPINQFLGSPVATDALTKLSFRAKDEEILVDVKAYGVDGFKVNLTWSGPDQTGLLWTYDPVPFPIVFISDGPNGAHPGVRTSSTYYVVGADFSVDSPRLNLLYGEVEIIEVLSGDIRRNRMSAAKID